MYELCSAPKKGKLLVSTKPILLYFDKKRITISFASFIPRSPRWLFTHGKNEQGKQALVKLAKQNKAGQPNFTLLEKVIEEENAIESSRKSYTYLSLIKFRSTRKKTFLFSYVWYVSTHFI